MMQFVFFDVDGVLIHGYHAKPELRQCWDAHIEEDLGVSRTQFTNDFIRKAFAEEVLTGKVPLAEALADFLPQTDYTGTVQGFIDYWLEHDSNVHHALFEKIKHLKESGQVRLFAATNQEHQRARYLMDTLGFGDYFEDIFYSARVGAVKPDATYFTRIAEMLPIPDGCAPIFFDDTQAVVDSARACGWQAHQFDHVQDLEKDPFIKSLLA